MATFKLPVWQTKTNRKVAKSVHQTRAATVADNFESHKNKVSDCGSGLLCWLQSRKASMAQIAITMIMGPADVQQYWSSNEPENCRKPVNMLCMAASSGRCGGADVTIPRSQLTSLHLVLPILYSHHPAPDTVISFHFLATNTSPPSHPHLANPTGHASMTIQL